MGGLTPAVPAAPANSLAERTVAPLPPAATATGTAPERQSLKDWPQGDQPRERLMTRGAGALATSELLAILLRSGTPRASALELAQELLQRADGSLRALSRLNYKDLAALHGIGDVKAVTLVAALELATRREIEDHGERPQLTTSRSAYQFVRPYLQDLPHEECRLLLLNAASRLVAHERLSVGSVDGTVLDVRSVLAAALRHNASAIILAHNHPSGNLDPSEADIAITRRIRAAAELMQVPLADHLIVAGRRYYSFRDAGMLQ